MSNLITYIKAQGDLDTPEMGKLYYEFVIRPSKPINPEKLMGLKQDVEDFERYLQEKYVIVKVKNIDVFSIWKRLKNVMDKLKR
jgi:hypothetical protein